MLRIMVIGAHADDPEGVAGLSVKWIKAGHTVKYLCATDGQSGHMDYPGYMAVEVRKKEAAAVKEFLGLHSYDFLDIEDGFLTTEIHNRERMMRAIREFAPDVIITHRPWDYHPDHRATGQLVQDCSYLVRVPNFLPNVPITEKMPTIFYMADTFKTPLPFRADVVVDVGDVIEEKITAYELHVSQMYEWLPWVDGEDMDAIPSEDEPKARREWHFNRRNRRWRVINEMLRPRLVEKYGQEKGMAVCFSEGLEACEYGGAHSEELYKELFGAL